MTRTAELQAPSPHIVSRGRVIARDCLTGAVLGGVVLAGLGLVGTPIHAGPITAILAGLLAAATSAFTWRFAGRRQLSIVVAALAVGLACFLLESASYPGSAFVIAALLGLGIGPLFPRGGHSARYWVPSALTAIGIFILVRATMGVGEDALLLAFLAIGAALLSWPTTTTPRRAIRTTYPVTGITVAFGLFAVFWVGSTAPTVEWFGSVYSHGPRSGNEVALTFDDGPNPPFTLEIASILESHGVRGTFFEVGKAVVQRPDITKQLIARGHTVGDHSYFHGAFSYLNPAYPELDKAQTAFKDAVGTCPALYRPPHGTHTPFMSDKIDGDGMTLINWDVSAQDWIETDPQRLAKNILARVKPGSIILLHDGIDGNIGADRSVILDALPLILDGLKAKGLQPVTVDKLLGVPAYLSSCG
ncbi:MAG TPA: polysaccharide deacetylase family protein [Tepidiformaceae bacterium]|nr:polysaccharide deacetylase family protein [Tepidiformaceae bacterium]